MSWNIESGRGKCRAVATATGRRYTCAVARLQLLASLVPLLVLAQSPRPTAEQAEGETPAVFRRYADQVVKLQVVEANSGSRAVTGTGFYVSAQGHVLTNYHVVSEIVYKPTEYRAELLGGTGGSRPVRVIAVDVVRDLAVVATDQPVRSWFTLEATLPVQGQRLYSLGHPGDLGIAIVEGTYNGRLPHTLYPRIHFTGSLNPGMSGGPTITLGGRVVGVNVSTSGNQQSFLVPVDGAAALLERALLGPAPPAESLLADVGRQLVAYQDQYLGRLFTDSVETVALGPWRAPTRPADFFNCWGDADRDEDRPYELIHHSCSTDEDVFLSSTQSSGTAEVEHDLLTSESLNRFRFHSLYTREFVNLPRDWEMNADGNEQMTGYQCRVTNVRRGDVTGKSIFCARAYKRLPGLYDVMFRFAVVGRPRQGLVSTLSLSGVSYENAQAVVRRFLEAIAWSE